MIYLSVGVSPTEIFISQLVSHHKCSEYFMVLLKNADNSLGYTYVSYMENNRESFFYHRRNISSYKCGQVVKSNNILIFRKAMVSPPTEIFQNRHYNNLSLINLLLIGWCLHRPKYLFLSWCLTTSVRNILWCY